MDEVVVLGGYRRERALQEEVKRLNEELARLEFENERLRLEIQYLEDELAPFRFYREEAA